MTVTKISAVLLVVGLLAGEARGEWKLSLGAGGGAKTSTVEIKAGRLVITGGVETTAWQLLSAAEPVAAGSWIRLGFTAGVRLDGPPGRFGDAYVGLAFVDSAGKPVGIKVLQIGSAKPAAQALNARVPEGAATVETRIFLSRPGRLEVSRVGLEVVSAPESFDVLVEDMGQFYSHFEKGGKRGKIDWGKLTKKYRARALAPGAFVDVVTEMLAELEDVHVSVVAADGTRRYPYMPQPARNMDPAALLKRVKLETRVGKLAAAGTVDGYGYLALSSLQASEADLASVEQALVGMLGRPGIILDLRPNIGGDESQAQRLVAWVADGEHAYARSAFRAGAGFGPESVRTLKGRGTYHGKVAVLIGPGCVSSCEGMAMMLAALPNATLVGQNTAGASGNPQPITLPNGVTVHYSRWRASMPDGTKLEGVGVPPDVRVVHVAGEERTLEAGIAALRGGK